MGGKKDDFLFGKLNLLGAPVHVIVVATRDALENTIDGPWNHQDCALAPLWPHLLEGITEGWNLYAVGQRSLRVSGIVFDPTRPIADVVDALAARIVGRDEVCLIVGLEMFPVLNTGALRVLDRIVHDPQRRFATRLQYGSSGINAYQRQFRTAFIVNGGDVSSEEESLIDAVRSIGFPEVIGWWELCNALGGWRVPSPVS